MGNWVLVLVMGVVGRGCVVVHRNGLLHLHLVLLLCVPMAPVTTAATSCNFDDADGCQDNQGEEQHVANDSAQPVMSPVVVAPAVAVLLLVLVLVFLVVLKNTAFLLHFFHQHGVWVYHNNALPYFLPTEAGGGKTEHHLHPIAFMTVGGAALLWYTPPSAWDTSTGSRTMWEMPAVVWVWGVVRPPVMMVSAVVGVVLSAMVAMTAMVV